MEDLVNILEKITDNYRRQFWKAINEDREAGRYINDKIINYLREKGWDMPQFRVSLFKDVRKTINEMDEKYGHATDNEYRPLPSYKDDDIIITFNLPKQFQQYFRKTDETKDPSELHIDKYLIPWGTYYWKTIWSVRSFTEHINYELPYKLDRIDTGPHTKDYFYMWRATPTYTPFIMPEAA